jgi:hypothetical protein
MADRRVQVRTPIPNSREIGRPDARERFLYEIIDIAIA